MNMIRLDVLVLVLYNVVSSYTENAKGQDLREQADRSQSGWGRWTEWSGCTAECGTGVMSRERQCMVEDSRSFCQGKSVEFKVCNTQVCVTGIQSTLREKLCSSHDGEKVGSGRYRWLPYMINKNGCKLTCRARGYGFYSNFPDSITNGTTCKVDGSAVCVQGVCTPIGCDGVVGSLGKVDRCGVCKGDNSSCHVMEGIFEDLKLANGYVFVKTIPAGATFINVTQLSRSRNYLALKSSTGTYLINGNRRLSRQGTIAGFGTKFHYHRRRTRRCPGECILASGPISESVDIMLLTFGPNYGIQFRYAYPNLEANHETSSGRSALEDAGTSVIHILDSIEIKSTASSFMPEQESEVPTAGKPLNVSPTDNAIIVEDDFKPGTHQKSGNADQNKSRNTTDSRSYTQSFKFMDKMKGSNGHKHNQGNSRVVNPIPDAPLADKRQPDGNGNHNNVYVVHPNQSVYLTGDGTVRTGRRPSYRLQIVGYSSCSRECGTGYKTPIIKCMAFNKPVRQDKCRNVYPRPRSQRVPCNTHPCHRRTFARWEPDEWSDCSVTCGIGEQRRNIRCVKRSNGNEVVEVRREECSYISKPEETRRCHKQRCYQWTTGNWGECSVTCGRGFRSRSVRCMTVDNQPAQVSFCDQGSKPSVNSGCDVGDCNLGNPIFTSNNDQSVHNNGQSSVSLGQSSSNVIGISYSASWYFTHWTHGCPVNCGRGTQNRKIACVRDDGGTAPESSCTSSPKPATLRDCKSRERCGAFWFTGPWGQCNVSCGLGSQSRSVVCVRRDQTGIHIVVPDFNCGGDNKPEAINICEMSPCLPEWYMTPWSKCSVTCGTGVATRDIKCLDANHHLSDECDEASKPNYREECNMAACTLSGRLSSPTLPPPKPRVDSDCTDKYSHCKMVTRTTLCSHSYYKQLCCKSCSLKLP